MLSRKFLKVRLFTLIALLSVLNSSIVLFAQTRRTSTVASNKPKASAKCSGAWTGSITYTRSQSSSNSKTVERVSGRGQDTTNFEMSYNYRAQVAVIEAPERNGSSIGRATVNHSMTSSETVDAKERNSCDRGKTWQVMSGNSTSKTETSGAETVEASVSVGVNTDGTYTVSVGIPQIHGKTSGSQTSSFSGQCTPKEGKSLSLPATPVTIDGNALTSDGTSRINPDDPNRISGSYSKTWLGVTETIKWSLQKCGAPLRLIDVKFEEMKFPDWNDWKEIVEQTGTTDGNLVKIKVRVLNASGETKYADVKFKETYKGDKWDGARPDGLLENGEASVRLDPGEEREVEIVWDSAGYAWYDDGRPRLVQRIKAELEENGKKVDELTKNLKVAPKPVVLVHGLWSNWKAWESWQNILTTTHSYDWKAFPVGEKPEKGMMNTGGAFLSAQKTNSIFENSQQLGKYIRYAQEDRNAWHIDIVAHSMGGLISRHYIHHFMPPVPDGRPQVAHLVMLGTPNMGSPCADVMNLAFEAAGKDVEAIRQLKPSVVEEFNRVTTNRKGVKFSVLAGNPLPVLCKTVVWNDGVVPVPSAIWKIKDNVLSGSVHTDLTGTADFSKFVKPRLAIGPKGNHGPEAPELPEFPGQVGRYIPRNYGMSFLPFSPDDEPIGREPTAASQQANDSQAKSVKLQPRQTTDVDIAVPEGLNFGITFMADSLIGASLVNDKGMVVGTNSARSPESRSWFRSIFYDKPTSGGTWKLRLENTSDSGAEVLLVIWHDAVK
jgi:pimeloyl-ACP methyl ester carboxylesterase